jgi:hypothetical protein
MPKKFVLVAVGFAGTIGALAAPVQRTRALNIHDSTLEIRDYSLARRAVEGNDQSTTLRAPGQYVTSTGCPRRCSERSDWFITSGSVDRHLIRHQKGTVPAGEINRGRRIYPLGEASQSTASTNTIACDHLQAAEHLQAQLIAMGLYTARMPGSPCPLPGMPWAALRAATDPAAAEHLKASRLAENQRLRAKTPTGQLVISQHRRGRRAVMAQVTATDPEAAENMKALRLAKNQRRADLRASVRTAAATDSKLAQHLESKRLAENRYRAAKRVAMQTAAATDFKLAQHLESKRLAENQYRTARRASKVAAQRLRAQIQPFATDLVGPLAASAVELEAVQAPAVTHPHGPCARPFFHFLV